MRRLVGSLAFCCCLVAAAACAIQAASGTGQGKPPLAAGVKKPLLGAADDPLPAGALERFGSMALRHSGVVSSLAWSHDGAWLASGSHDKTICIWDAKTGNRLKRFTGHTDAVFAIALSADSKQLASASRDKTVRVWDVATGKELWQSVAHGAAVCCVAFSPDGKILASGCGDAAVRLWDVVTGKELRRLADPVDQWYLFGLALGSNKSVHTVAFSPDGKILASGGKNKAVRLWGVSTGKKISELVTGPPAMIHGVAFSPDGKTLAAAAVTAPTHLWDAATGKLLVRLADKGFEATGVAFSRDGKTLVLCPAYVSGGSSVVRFIEAKTGANLHSLDTSIDPTLAVTLSPDGQTAACAGDGPIVRLLDVHTGKVRLPAGAEKLNLTKITKTREYTLPAKISQKEIFRSAMSYDGRVFAYADEPNRIHVWDMAKGKEVKDFVLPVHPWQFVTRLALSPDGSVIAVVVDMEGNESGQAWIQLWDWATGKKLQDLGGDRRNQPQLGLAFSPDGRSLAASNYFGEVCVWETATGNTRVGWWHFHDSLFTTLRFSPDSRLVAIAYSGGTRGYVGGGIEAYRYKDWWWFNCTVELWDLATAEKIASFEGHLNEIRGVAFFAGGKKLASLGWEGLAYVWPIPQLAKKPAAALTPKQLEDSWAALAGGRDKPGQQNSSNQVVQETYAAQCKLIATANAVEFLKKQFKPVPLADPAVVAFYCSALDGDKYAVREKATTDLKKLGDASEAVLRKLLEGNPTLELRRRVELLLEPFDGAAGAPKRLRQDRALEVLERIGDADARALLKSLADGAPGMWLTRQAKASLNRLTALQE